MKYESVEMNNFITYGYNYKVFFKLLIKFYNLKKKKPFERLVFLKRENSGTFRKILRRVSYLFQENLKKYTHQVKNYQINLFLAYFALVINAKNYTCQRFFKKFSIFCKSNKYYNLFNLSLKSHLTCFDVSAYFSIKINEIYIYENFKRFYQLLISAGQLFRSNEKEKKILKFVFLYPKKKRKNSEISRKTCLYVENFLTRNSEFKTIIFPSVYTKKKTVLSGESCLFFNNMSLHGSFFEKLISLNSDCNLLDTKNFSISNAIYFWRYRYASFSFLCVLINFSINKNIIKFDRLTKQVNTNKSIQENALYILSEFSKFDIHHIFYQKLNNDISFIKLCKICQLHLYIFHEKENYFSNTLIV